MPISWSKEDSKHDGVQIYVSRSLADMLGTNPPPLGMLITYYLNICVYINIHSYAIFSMRIGIGFTFSNFLTSEAP